MLLDFNIIKGPCRETKEIIKREMELIFQEIALDKRKQSQKLMKTKRKKMKYFRKLWFNPNNMLWSCSHHKQAQGYRLLGSKFLYM